MSEPEFVHGSFRDRGSRVFVSGEKICRALTAEAAAAWHSVSAAPSVAEALVTEDIIRTEPFDTAVPDGFETVLQHRRLPLITWPFEWSFGMLKDAALLHLELLERCLADGVILKDGTPYNVQFDGVRPIFIDVGSFEPLKDGHVWEGYQQFCRMFLYPLMAQCYFGTDFQPLLRGRLDGPTPAEFRRMMSLRDLARPGVMSHVLLHAVFSNRSGRDRDADSGVARSLEKSGFSRDMILNNVRGLLRLVRRLSWKPPESAWTDYDSTSEPVQRDAAVKESFIQEIVAQRFRHTVWDIGCNLGRYSRIAASNSECVAAMDIDHSVIERLYEALKSEQQTRITPVVFNPADPSPGMGWRGTEREPFEARSKPDLILALAVIHHLVIGSNLLLTDVLDWLRERNSELVIEFVCREDPQVRMLLANRRDVFSDYSLSVFERELARRFEVTQRRELDCQTRILFHAVPS